MASKVIVSKFKCSFWSCKGLLVCLHNGGCTDLSSTKTKFEWDALTRHKGI